MTFNGVRGPFDRPTARASTRITRSNVRSFVRCESKWYPNNRNQPINQQEGKQTIVERQAACNKQHATYNQWGIASRSAITPCYKNALT